jgi:hypothetical protein
MGFDPRSIATPLPGHGPGWTRVAEALRARVSPEEVEAIWLFPPTKREEREWGVAVVSCSTEDKRSRIYTASYMMVVRGRERGHGKVAVEEVGESPATVLEDVIRGVQDRAGEDEPPREISPSIWFGDDHSEVHQRS